MSHCHHCHDHGHGHDHDHGHSHDQEPFAKLLRNFAPELLSLLILIVTASLSHAGVLHYPATLILYLGATLIVGWPVLLDALREWRRGDIMNEFTLMILASIGAFFIGEYPEGLAVLLFYSFGEKLQDRASDKARAHIRGLIDKLPDTVEVIEADGTRREGSPKTLPVGTRIAVKPGMRLALDATLDGDSPAAFDTSAITGESVPRTYAPGQKVPSGCIPVDREVVMTTATTFDNSSMSRIMQTIEEASKAKSKTESMLRRITRWYTPIVMIAAVLLFVGAWIFTPAASFDWQMWLNRSLVFLVCACPCALVVSVPLAYFASLGKASANGLLVKGSTYFDAAANANTFVFDKTGTLTTGKFDISAIEPAGNVTADRLLSIVAGAEAQSSHPLAAAIRDAAAKKGVKPADCSDIRTVLHGLTATLDGKKLLVGSPRLLDENGVKYSIPATEVSTEILVSLDGEYLGRICLRDSVKPEAAEAVRKLKAMGDSVIILSGDREAAVAEVGEEIGADSWESLLKPEEKYDRMRQLKKEGRRIVYVGDGINDTPALALADVGIAMGAGTDVAMEHADVVIATGNLLKVPQLVRIARRARQVSITNVVFALGVKALVMSLGAFGIATLWAAVFADTGVTFIAIIYTLLAINVKWGHKKS